RRRAGAREPPHCPRSVRERSGRRRGAAARGRSRAAGRGARDSRPDRGAHGRRCRRPRTGEMTRMNRTTTFLAGAGLILGLSASACGTRTDAARADAAVPVTVRTHALEPADIEDTFEAGGVVQAHTSATLASRIL